MIKPSDITVTVTKDNKAYASNTVVEATLEIHETCTVSRFETKLIDHAKEKMRHAVLMRLYGDLRNDLEEMYALAMMKMPYGHELDKVREAKKRIDAIMRGGE